MKFLLIAALILIFHAWPVSAGDSDAAVTQMYLLNGNPHHATLSVKGGTQIIGRDFYREGKLFHSWRLIEDPTSKENLSLECRDSEGHLLRRLEKQAPFPDLSQSPKSGPIIAVIDSGIDYRHPDLASHLWVNDDVIGWDFDHNTRYVTDVDETHTFLPDEMVTGPDKIAEPSFHGTHVASIVLGPRPGHKRIMPLHLEVTDPDQWDRLSRFFDEHTPDVVNISMGMLVSSKFAEENRGIDRLNIIMRKFPNVLFVVAAGNSKLNIDSAELRAAHLKFKPACFRSDNLIVVGASNGSSESEIGTERAKEFSNYGPTSVHLLAPGIDIEGADAGSAGRTRHSGTSGAAPFVSRIAAEILEINPKLKAQEIKAIILETATQSEELKLEVEGGRILSPSAALRAAQGTLQNTLAKAISQAKSSK